jgi:outer membrane protein assembly factor BamE (lipoprotein component of BamABCDE complex)
MKNLFLFLIISLFLTACTLKKVVNHHGVHFLDKKKEKLIINSSNKNDIKKLLGPPISRGFFDNDLWIYIERKNSKKSIIKLGKKHIITNNVLVLEINNRGILLKKDFYDLNSMNKVKFSKQETENVYSKDSFVYDFLSSMRQKINDPLGKRKKN